MAARGCCGAGLCCVHRGAPVDSRLLSWAACIVFVVLSVECTAVVVGSRGGLGLCRCCGGGGSTSISAGSSTGAAGDGIAYGVLVARKGAKVALVARASARVLARGIWLFQRGKEVDVGVRGGGAYLVRGATAGVACLDTF